MPRSAILEAQDAVGVSHTVRVLEPSPPGDPTAPWFADDPVSVQTRDGRDIVSPVENATITWDAFVREQRPDLATFAAERWLGAYRTLGPAPSTLVATRRALHLLAENVLSPTRQRAEGAKIGLRWTLGGFGTPFFGHEVQIRVVGDVLIVQTAAREARGQITTLRGAAEFVGFELTRFDLAGAGDPLPIDPEAAGYLGEVFGFGTSVLEQLRAEADPATDEPSRVQIWPEHFDVAVEVGSETDGRRAGYGLSPGDDEHPEPYLYVTPWASEGFSALPFADLLGEPDQRGAALAWLRTERDALSA